jgi:DNA-binding XRE family transcriptional regulator
MTKYIDVYRRLNHADCPVGIVSARGTKKHLVRGITASDLPAAEKFILRLSSTGEIPSRTELDAVGARPVVPDADPIPRPATVVVPAAADATSIRRAVGKRIHAFRKAAGISMAELGRRLHVSRQRVLQIEAGAGLTRIDDIAVALGVPAFVLASAAELTAVGIRLPDDPTA